MPKYQLQTVEYSFDHVPWYGDYEEFNTLAQCNRRVNELRRLTRHNDVMVYVLDSSTKKVIKSTRLERLPYSF